MNVPSTGGPFGDEVIASWQEALDWEGFERWYQFCGFNDHRIDRNAAYLAYMLNRLENTIVDQVSLVVQAPVEDWQQQEDEDQC